MRERSERVSMQKRKKEKQRGGEKELMQAMSE